MQSEEGNTVKKLEFKDGDDGDGPVKVTNWNIDVVENGFVVTTTFDSEEEYTEVCYTIDELLTIVEASFKGG